MYFGIDDDVLYTSSEDMQSSINDESEEASSKTSEDNKVTSPALKNIKKKLLTIRSWPNLIRNPPKQLQ